MTAHRTTPPPADPAPPQAPAGPPGGELIDLRRAEKACLEEAGISAARFRHALAEYARGRGGLPWVATETALGIPRAALDDFLLRHSPDEPLEDDHDTDTEP